MNNDGIRQRIATILKESHYTDNPEVDVVDAVMKAILTVYQYYPYYNQSIREGKIEDNLTLKGILEKATKVNELEEEVEALKVELEKSDDRIEELEERVDI
ncbi:10543_t:CDS:2 [Entrophospora sp. SA101]|nr:10543_t:CDS:2 [Entrophospora sp. SA101]